MGNPTRVPEDLVVPGALLGMSSIQYPDGSIVNADLNAAADIAVSKCEVPLSLGVHQQGTAVTARLLARVVMGATGNLRHFVASNATPCAGASTVSVDLQKDGATVLGGVLSLDAATGVRGIEVAVIGVAELAADDVLEVVITANQSGTDALATGVYAQIEGEEDYLA